MHQRPFGDSTFVLLLLCLFLVLLFCRRLSYLIEEVTFEFFQGFKRVRTKPQCFSASFPGGVVVKNPPTIAGDAEDSGLIPGLGRSPGGGNGNSLRYPHLENPLAWRTEEPGGRQSMGLQRVRHNWACTHTRSAINHVLSKGGGFTVQHAFGMRDKE